MSFYDIVISMLGSISGAMIFSLFKKYFSVNKKAKAISKAMRFQVLVKKRHGSYIKEKEIREKLVQYVNMKNNDIEDEYKVKLIYETLAHKKLDVEFIEAKNESGKIAGDEFEKYIKIISNNRSTMIKVFNSGLLHAIVSSKLSSIRPSDTMSASILDLMLGERMKAYSKAYIFSIASVVFVLLVRTFFDYQHPLHLDLLVPLLFVCVLYINQKILEYRIKNGYFGNNATEAAEFIQFIKSHSEKSDFGDGEKMKKLYPNTESVPCVKKITYDEGLTA